MGWVRGHLVVAETLKSKDSVDMELHFLHQNLFL